MKKGDTISKETILPIGTPVLLNVSSPEVAKAYMETDFLMEYGIIPAYEIRLNEETGQQEVLLTQEVVRKEEALVNWVIDGEAALELVGGGCKIISLEEEKDWVVIKEGVPSYQSSVANMTDEALRQAIDDLRNQRVSLPSRVKRSGTPKEKVNKNDPVTVALASMPQDKKEELMRKLGMVD